MGVPACVRSRSRVQLVLLAAGQLTGIIGRTRLARISPKASSFPVSSSYHVLLAVVACMLECIHVHENQSLSVHDACEINPNLIVPHIVELQASLTKPGITKELSHHAPQR